MYVKLDPVRITCPKRFFSLNVIIRVSVKGLVAILLLCFKVLVRSETYLPNRPMK